ncbi:MAG: PQQ-binding-like beta-propeller repeat protein [Bryobacterales bacterium]|nr:PQQ-binding-like beta-propeller repeat protein [Bryobacterales bacterium]
MLDVSRWARLCLLTLGLALAAAWVATGQQPRRVDDIGFREAGRTGDEWISYNVNWFEQRYSPLTQINTSNVSRLGLGWYTDIPAAPGNPQNRQEATPLVYNGVVYSITPWSVVYAVDARTGKEMWRSDPEVNQQVWQSRICCGIVNRGIALYQDKIIAPVVDGRLRALDQTTGRIAWETRVSPENMPYTITMAPRVIKGGKIIVGVSGGEYGIRGFFDAYDADTGKRAWRFYTVPGDPSKPFEQPELADWAKTWSAEWWKIGGGAPVWGGVAYDPDADIVYVGTGQPGPWTSVHRGKGDNLCTDCIIAVRGSTGKYVWHYQTTPGDDWDYDSIADIMLADLTINGKLRHVLMHAPKNGFFYVLDRHTGELLSADPWVQVTWASGVNLKTGRPTVNPEARYGTDSVSVMPGPGGGHVWPPWSYNPTTGLVYIPSTSGQPYSYNANPDYTPVPTDIGPTGRGQMNMGTGRAGGGRGGAGGGGRGAAGAAGGPPPGVDPAAVAAGRGGNVPPGVDPAAVVAGGGRGGAGAGRGPAPPVGPAIPSIGPEGRGNFLIAWDPVAQKERWRVAGGSAGFNQGGTLSTAGNLVFSSVNTRLLAYRADTGEQILDMTTGLSQMGPPMTFMIDGKQYVAVAGGPPGAGGGRGGAGAAGRGGAQAAPVAPAAPPQPSRLLVYTLDGKATLPPPPAPPAAQ